MSDIMSTVIGALKHDQNRLEQLSLNAANASTPGYKRSSLVAMSFDQVFQNQETQLSSQSPARAGGAAMHGAHLVSVVDFSQGALIATGRDLDLAVEGKGFLVLTEGDRTYLTRSVSLRRDLSGELQDAAGRRLAITANQSPESGDVSAVARLVMVDDPSSLRSTDGVLFDAADLAVRDVSAGEGLVRSGFQESANTNHLQEMLGVMESVRRYESVIRIAQGYDEVLGKAIQKLGEV